VIKLCSRFVTADRLEIWFKNCPYIGASGDKLDIKSILSTKRTIAQSTARRGVCDGSTVQHRSEA
jgi:hypothetical protein